MRNDNLSPSSLGVLASWRSWLVFLLTSAPALAAPPPSINNLNVRGLQAGATTTLVIDGSDLLPEPRLVTTAPIVKQELKPNPAPNRIEIDVTLDAKADPGLYNLWLATAKGMSQRQVIAVDGLPQKPLRAPVDALPVALHGNFAGGRAVETSFPGKAGERVTIEVESIRLGGREQPVIHLVDPAGREIGMALPSPLLRGDSRLIATLPVDGLYRARVHDLQYGGGGPLRLKIGSWQYADLAFPPAVERGRSAQVMLLGGEPAGPRVDLIAPGGSPVVAPPWSDPAKSSGPRPVVQVSLWPELVEAEAMTSPEAPQDLGAARPPFAVSGRLAKPGEQDFYRIAATPDQTLRFEIFADRLGSPIDAALEIRNAKGDRLAENDDAAESADPRLDFKVPAGVDALVVAVRDVHGRGFDAGVYRLAVTSGDDPRPDFDLAIEHESLALTAGAPHLMKVTARRRNYGGPIRLRLDGPAAGWVGAANNEIPAGQDAVLVTLTGGVQPTAAAAVGAVVGEGNDPSGAIARVAAAGQHPLAELQPWLRGELALASAGEPDVAFTADFGDVPADRKLVPGAKVLLPVKCARPVGFDGPVRLTLLSNHATPLDGNARPDNNRAVRSEPERVDIPADAKAQQAFDAKVAAEKAVADAQTALDAAATNPDANAKPAAEAALKQATDALAAAEAAAVAASAAAKNDADVTVQIPNDLPLAPGAYDVAFRADLMSRDNARVLATRFTPIKRLPAASPVVVQLSAAPRVEVRLAADGATAKWSGTIERREGATGEVVVFLENLPNGLPQPRITVPADKSAFDLELKLPPNAPPGESGGIRLVAEIKGANGQPVSGTAVEVSLSVLPMEPPKTDAK